MNDILRNKFPLSPDTARHKLKIRLGHDGPISYFICAIGIKRQEQSGRTQHLYPAQPQHKVANEDLALGKKRISFEASSGLFDASDLENLSVREGNTVSFYGTLHSVFSPEGNYLTILNFDQEYRNAVSVVIGAKHYSKFPVLRSLLNLDILVTGVLNKYVNKDGEQLLSVRVRDPEQLNIIET